MKLKFRRALQAAEALHRKRHQALRRQMSAMHPELVAGSYKRYKTDTNTFTTWLAKSAAACGYKIPKDVPQEPSSTAPPKPTEPTHREKIMTLPEKLRAQADKKREKREGKKTPGTVPATSIPIVPSTVTHTVRTQDLLRQAEVVSKNAKIQVPDAILQVVKRAINARKRCAEWFAQTGIDNGHSTERHMHFAKVLENAMEILKPGFGKADGVYAAVQHTAPNTQLKPKPGTTALHDLSGLNNRFSNLEVEGTEDFVEPSTALQLLPVSGTPVKPSQKAPTPKAVDVYELEQDNAWEKMFDVYCFFEDLHRIQEFLNDTWKKYKHGEIDLLSATIITNSAFDIIRREEEQVTAFAFGHQKLSYIDLCTMIFFAEAFGKNKSMNSLLESSGTLRITPFDNFIYLSTARSLMKFEKFTSMKIQYPQPVPPARLQYVFDQDLLELPEIKKMEEEDTFLCQYLMDFTFNELVMKAQNELKADLTTAEVAELLRYAGDGPVRDELSRGLQQLQNGGQLSTWLVFACRILIDIQNVLGPQAKRGYYQLEKDATFAKDNLHAEIIGEQLTVHGERWRTGLGDKVVMKIYDDCRWLLVPLYQRSKEDALAKIKSYGTYLSSIDETKVKHPEAFEHFTEKHNAVEAPDEMKERFKTLQLQPILPNREEQFLYARNPIYCGFKAFQLALDVEEAGTYLETHHQSVYVLAHLYNAARQTGLLTTSWPELDLVIDLQMGSLFAGALPKSEKECFNRFKLQLGFSTQKIARDARTHTKTLNWKNAMRTGMENGPQMVTTKMSAIFRQYFAKKQTLEQCLYQLEMLVQEENSESPVNKSKSKALAKQQYQPQLTPLQFLTHIQSYFPGVVKHMQIDYISLVRTSRKILKKIRKELKEKLEIEHYFFDDSTEDSNEPGYILMGLDILKEASTCQELREDVFSKEIKEMKEVGKEPALGGPQLVLVAEILDKMVKKIVKADQDKRNADLEEERKMFGDFRQEKVEADPNDLLISEKLGENLDVD